MKSIKYLLISSLFCLVFSAFSQNVILQGTPQTDNIPQKGANRQQYFWVQLSLFGTDLVFNELNSKQNFGNYYGLSLNKKYKLNSVFSHGFGIGMHHQAYNLSNSGLDSLSYSDWNKGRLNFTGLNLNYFLRLNFDPKRGNIIGKYLDIMPFYQHNFHQRATFERGKVTEKKVKSHFPERYAIGAEARLGYNFFSIYVRYKYLSGNNLTHRYADLDLARWSVGLNLNIGD